MELDLERPIVFFDIESTGLNIAVDAIIELCLLKVNPDHSTELKTWKIKPWDYITNKQIHINESASEVNGVYDEDLKNCPTFLEKAIEICDFLRNCDLAGYNSNKFDLPMLSEEIERAKNYCESKINGGTLSPEKKLVAEKTLKALDMNFDNCKMVDVQNIFHFMEPRNLKAACRFYCNKDIENAHTAEADTVATYEILKAQLDKYSSGDNIHNLVLKNNIKALSDIGNKSNNIDYAGRLILKDGEAVINFGKHKGRLLRDIFKEERSYFSWVERGDFTLDTKRRFKELEKQYKEEGRESLKLDNNIKALQEKWSNR